MIKRVKENSHNSLAGFVWEVTHLYYPSKTFVDHSVVQTKDQEILKRNVEGSRVSSGKVFTWMSTTKFLGVRIFSQAIDFTVMLLVKVYG